MFETTIKGAKIEMSILITDTDNNSISLSKGDNIRINAIGREKQFYEGEIIDLQLRQIGICGGGFFRFKEIESIELLNYRSPLYYFE